MTKEDKKILRKYASEREYLVSHFLSIFTNAVTITGMPESIPAEVVIRWLAVHGQVGAYSPTGNAADVRVWKCAPAGVDFYGLPDMFELYGDNGASLYLSGVNAKNVVRIRANTECLPVFPRIYAVCERLIEVQKSINQNLKATRNAGIISASKENADRIKKAYSESLSGIPAIIETDIGTSLMDAVRYTGTGAPYMCDRYRQLYTELRDELLTEMGVLTANRDKRERVQSAEVNAGITEAYDFLGRLIDQFNRDAAPLGWKMEYNNTLDEILTGEFDSDMGGGI